jgi:alpha-amylase/alpha-mannosidase (GH57 family)
MDIVDESKDAVTDKFLGNNNEQDVLNTQLAVINRLLELLRRGNLRDELYELTGTPNVEPFTDRFENKVAGWTLSLDVLIPNDMTIC